MARRFVGKAASSMKTYRLIIAALVCAIVIPLAFVVQILLAR